ncbi:Transposase [Planktothrix tepida]|uniref:Transposase n=1 Tax=Planktothrix tepida PCC 9214 TaxID=671072 RepID=A0A1J1LQN3_9CYAN|nr:transposase [Planktothrix tepida]CAD5963435.1 Transposase [Planktothrix tepida]CUR34885.1 transposase [Planktothrix tepida PCC 9214]
MPSNSLLYFITQIINFPGFKATNYHFITENELLIELENKQTNVTCPNCGKSRSKVHQSHRHRVRDIPVSSFDVFLNVNRRQFRCPNCQKVFSEELSFVKKRRTYTKRLAQKVVEEVLATDVVNTGKRNRMSPAEIETILKEMEAVSIDLWVPYKSVVEELMPNAQVVADRFHVMKQVNEELDYRRKTEKKQAEKIKNKTERERQISGIKESKYPLLKKKEDLNETEKSKLSVLKEVMPELMDMYDRKEKFRDIFESQITGDEAFWQLVEWTESSYKDFPKSCQTIKRWIAEILAYFDNRTTQGAVEGINQKIKLIKRRAYGLNNFANFRRRVLLNWHFSPNLS